jgi:hypothetical protein
MGERKTMNELIELSELIKKHNAVDNEISALIDRPALTGHLGEFIASKIFGIKLEESASTKSIDGFFQRDPLKNKSVNIKWFPSHDGLMNFSESPQPDYYLVLTGPHRNPGRSRGHSAPWVITKVYLFDAQQLVSMLIENGRKVGTASSVRKHLWEAAEIYPKVNDQLLPLTAEQKQNLALFSSET